MDGRLWVVAALLHRPPRRLLHCFAQVANAPPIEDAEDLGGGRGEEEHAGTPRTFLPPTLNSALSISATPDASAGLDEAIQSMAPLATVGRSTL